MINPLAKREPFRAPEILRAAKGEECTVNGPSCNFDSSTVVAAHFNAAWAGKGEGLKADDCAVVFACYCCHKWLDGEDVKNVSDNDRQWYWLRAYYRTIRRLFDKHVIMVVKGE